MMKKILIFIIVPFLFIGCNKEKTESLFGVLPEERMAERLEELQSKLLESPSGWKATLNTGTSSSKGAYNFYIDFNDDNSCKMQGDLSSATATDWHNSTYRIIWAMNASILFDTFTYITMLQEPSATYGGTAPHGYRSDIEFEYIRSTTDSIFLKGKKYQHDLVLTKVTTNAEASLDAGEFAAKIQEVVNFFAENTNAYFETGDGVKYAVAIDRIAKTISITWLDNQENVHSRTSGFAYSLNGIDIFQPISFNGTWLTRIDFDNDDVKMVSLSGSYEVENNAIPILPITTLFAANGAFNAIVVEGPNLPPGITSEFNTVWQNNINFYAANSATLEYMRFSLVNSTTARLSVGFRTQGAVYISQAEYSYTYVGNVIKLSNPPTSTNGNYNNGWLQAAMKNYFIGAEFTLDYVVSSNPDIVNIGGLYRTDNPNSFFYGKLAKL
ncbi:DUF4302 domain-containing protein [Sphingobacterium olei]|uniref:DUF4302 domain-containing protein n=1 Tax=Sphingobacterium olei TaxID=2571155 RepID=A0A4U0P2D4_9SPHI|nr:DUF4302 domain-containing protein [Sphingobacterium olei]TJZ60702.1 DUF4302 domain-containing protein [Sphingobacterium olei]